MWKDHIMGLSLDLGRDVERSYYGLKLEFRTGCGKIIPWTKAWIQDGMWKDHIMGLSLDLGRDVEGAYNGLKVGFRTGCVRSTQWTKA